MKKKVALITGSEGFVGTHLIKYLHNHNYYIIATYYKKIKKFNSTRIKYIKCDVRNKSKVFFFIKKFKPDEIYHLAAKSLPSFSFKNPIETINTNVIGTINILEAVKFAKINPKILIACSSAQYGKKKFKDLPLREDNLLEPEHLYGLSKLFQNLLALQYYKMFGLRVYRAIIFNTSGPGKVGDVFSDFCSQFVNNKIKGGKKIIKIGDINKYRDFLHVNDLVKGLNAIVCRGIAGESYNLCSSRYYKIKEIIDLMKNQTKFKIVIKKKKNLIRKFDEKYIFGSNKKIKKIGWKPYLNLKNIFEDVCVFYEKKKYQFS